MNTDSKRNHTQTVRRRKKAVPASPFDIARLSSTEKLVVKDLLEKRRITLERGQYDEVHDFDRVLRYYLSQTEFVALTATKA